MTYENKQEIINEGKSYNFYKIVIRRKAKLSKEDPNRKYLCDVYSSKDDKEPVAWYIYEKTLDNIMEGLGD